MRVIIGGSRDITDYDLVCRVIEVSGIVHHISEVVSGKARGVDALGERWADERFIPKMFFPAQWGLHDKKTAGPIRNGQMADYADAAILVWDGESPGTQDMAEKMARRRKACYVWNTKLHIGGWNAYGQADPPIRQAMFRFDEDFVTKPKRGYGE